MAPSTLHDLRLGLAGAEVLAPVRPVVFKVFAQ
jgi:hypothetical protein